MKEKRGVEQKKRLSRKIWGNRVKKASSRPKVENTHKWVNFNTFWKMLAQGVRGESGGEEGRQN